jgi:hypothetical protein
MSPTNLNFSQLSINPKMQASGSSQQGRQTGKGKGRAAPDDNPTTPNKDSKKEYSEEEGDEDEDEDEDSDSEDEDDADPTADTVSGKPLFALDHCRQIGAKYAFQIAYAEVQNISVRISAEDTDGLSVTCSCNIDSCPHVKWLLEQLARSRTRDTGRDAGPYEHITAIGLSNICRKLGWEWVETGVVAAENEYQLLKKGMSTPMLGAQSLQEKIDTTCDILATFSPNKFADDLKSDIFGPNPERSVTTDVLAPHDLETTLARMLVGDDDLLCRFRSVVPRDIRASEYFRKMAERAEFTTVLLDDFSVAGRQHHDVDHTVIWCADQLVNIVESIHQNVALRQPLSPECRGEAAGALIKILDLVVLKNQEVYQSLDPSVRRKRPHGEPQTARNLYMCLIGVSREDNPAGGTFVLKALEDLPEAASHVEKLEEILAKLDSIAWKAPQAYLSKLRGIISRLRGDTISSTSSGKARLPMKTRKRRDAGEEASHNAKRLK